MNFTTNPGGVKSAINKKRNVAIIDVRKESDFKAGHIPGVINLPFDKWDGFNYVYCYELLCNLAQKAS